MDKNKVEVLYATGQALEGQLRMLEIAKHEGNLKAAVHDLNAMKYLITRCLSVLTNSTEPDEAAVAHGPAVSTPRINGPEFRELLIREMINQETVTPRGLVAALTEKGVPLPGKGDSANVIIHLKTLMDQGIVTRDQYGEYRLSAEARPQLQPRRTLHTLSNRGDGPSRI